MPEHSRPRDGRPATGVAVDRQYPPYTPTLPIYPIYPGYPSYPIYWWPGAGLGFGYYYDPGWYDPYGYGQPFGFYGGTSPDPYGYGGQGSGTYSKAGTGTVRLKLKPRDAQVYVDGYYVGTVDQFDGLFQKLALDAGTRRIEVRAEGHEVAKFELVVVAGETVTYEGELKRNQ